MIPMKSDLLRVSGANIYYEVRGSGPVLLLIHGGGGDARGFSGVANHLANQYTVVTYDRRGLFRSRLDDPEEEQRVEVHSDDAHYLLAALTTEPAYVFGSSGGAVIGLDLVTRYPEQVRMLVAHEPPAQYLLPDAEQSYKDGPHEDVQEIYRREGAVSAFQKFVAQIGVSYDDMEPDVDLRALGTRSMDSIKFLFEHEFGMFARYRFDFVVLSKVSTRIVLAVGQSGREFVGYRNAVAVADHLGTAVVEFPGHHVGYISHPRAFAEKLREVFGGASGS